jgi:hypothetical protein
LDYYSTRRFVGDTTIGSTIFSVLDAEYALCLVREDTVAGKVFVRYIPGAYGGSNDTVEQVLYDYNLRIGDTTFHSVDGVTYFHVVSSLDSILIQGVYHKIWRLEGYTFPYTVIEGIGCTTYPTFPIVLHQFERSDMLTCYANKYGQPLISPAVSMFDNSTSCKLDISPVRSDKRDAKVIPNPVGRGSKIVMPYCVQSGFFDIVDDMGKHIAAQAINDQSEILIDDKVILPGIYFYRVIDNGSAEVFTGKFVRE